MFVLFECNDQSNVCDNDQNLTVGILPGKNCEKRKKRHKIVKQECTSCERLSYNFFVSFFSNRNTPILLFANNF